MFRSLQPAAYAVSFVFFTLASISTALRFYSRKCIIRSFGWMIGGWCLCWWICNTCQQGVFCLFLHYGGGLFVTDSDLALLFAEEILYIWMQFIIKHGFLQIYLRLANKTSFLYSIYATMALNLAIAIALCLLYCLQCRPLPAFWNLVDYPGAICLKTSVTYYVPVSLNILTDVIILSLPIRPLWKLQASRSRRLGVLAVISLGAAACIIYDFTCTLGKMVIIPAVALDVAITAANAPYIPNQHPSSLSEKKVVLGCEPLVIRHPLRPKHEGTFLDTSSTNDLLHAESRDIEKT
ncbi:uncharacterized protein BDV14DRAFT_193225 [Aspergillus stella-maris]|uniref:uncharacterized protein n=1 Tax=Aspergillus stella-maris TaxID=1810926 RepID=UPI003CCD29DD